jgi:2-dehydropantoate 2-reductase
MNSSMNHDLQTNRPLEVNWLSGGVVKLGKEKGVPTPANSAVCDILALYADGPVVA